MNTVAVCSGKGSPGATFVAVNLAVSLARENEVLLVDCDPWGGDVAAYLGLNPRRGLYPLLRMESSVPDHAALMREAEERDGLAAVCGFPDPCPENIAWKIPGVVRAARRAGRHVVIDVGRVSDRTAALAAEANLLLLVVRPDLISVAGAERALRQLMAREFPIDRVRTVVSGLDRRRPGDVAEVGKALGVPVLSAIPVDRRGARRALVSQAPISKGRVPRAFRDLAAALPPERTEAPSLAQPAEVAP